MYLRAGRDELLVIRQRWPGQGAVFGDVRVDDRLHAGIGHGTRQIHKVHI